MDKETLLALIGNASTSEEDRAKYQKELKAIYEKEAKKKEEDDKAGKIANKEQITQEDIAKLVEDRVALEKNRAEAEKEELLKRIKQLDTERQELEDKNLTAEEKKAADEARRLEAMNEELKKRDLEIEILKAERQKTEDHSYVLQFFAKHSYIPEELRRVYKDMSKKDIDNFFKPELLNTFKKKQVEDEQIKKQSSYSLHAINNTMGQGEMNDSDFLSKRIEEEKKKMLSRR